MSEALTYEHITWRKVLQGTDSGGVEFSITERTDGRWGWFIMQPGKWTAAGSENTQAMAIDVARREACARKAAVA